MKTENKTVYHLNPVLVAQGVVGNLVLQDLGGGFQMVKGNDYDFEAMFGPQAVIGSNDLNLALNLGWVHKKVIEPEPAPKTKAAPKTKTKGKAATKPKAEPEAEPEAETKLEPFVPTSDDMAKASQVFDLAKGMGTIYKEGNKWIVPVPESDDNKKFGSPVEIIDALACDPEWVAYIQKLNQGE